MEAKLEKTSGLDRSKSHLRSKIFVQKRG